MIAALHEDQLVRVERGVEYGHVRTPGYLRGRHGRILEVVGGFPDPNVLARGGLGLPYRMLYRVAFCARDIWPEYAGSAADEIVADLYEHHLQAREDNDG